MYLCIHLIANCTLIVELLYPYFLLSS